MKVEMLAVEKIIPYQDLRERPRSLGRGWIARRTKFAFFLPDVFSQGRFDIVGKRSIVLLRENTKLRFEIGGNFHVQHIF